MLTSATLLPFSTALGWTFVHSLWQISLTYGLFRLLQHVFSKQNVQIYNLSILAMFICAAWSAVTFQQEYTLAQPVKTGLVIHSDRTPVLLNKPTGADAASALFTPDSISWKDYIPQVGIIWSICVVLLYLRLLGGFWVARRLRRRGTVQVTGAWQENCNRLAKQLGITGAVSMLESQYIAEPLTLGFWKPVILFPTGLLLQLTPAQLEALLLHELVHIRRYDYVLNALQLLLEATFFYHPLFRLLARTARTRREYCCDDVVLQHCPNRLLYARTLTDLQLTLVHRKNQFVMNATGKDNFTTRILRIVGVPSATERRAPWMLLILLFVSIATGSVWSVLNATNTPQYFAEMILNEPAGSKFAGDNQMRNALKINTIAYKTIQDSVGLIPKKPVQPATIEAPPVLDSFPNNAVAVVAPLKMNVLYIGVDNPVNIAVGGYNCAALQVRVKGPGSITSIGECQYNITTTAPGQLAVQIYTMQDGKEKLLGENAFRVKRIPDPRPAFSNFYSGVITQAQLQQLTTVTAMLQNFDFDAQCTIVEFNVTILPYKQNPSSQYNVPGTFPKELLDRIHALQSGDALFIDDIKVKCSGDAVARNLGSLAFKIKE